MAENPEEAVHRVRVAVDVESMDPEMKFTIHSCTLLEENVEADVTEVKEQYEAIDKRTLN